MFEVYGEKEVMKNIDTNIKIVSKTTTEGLIEVGERGVGYLKRLTPVDSGRLRNSMAYTIDKKIYTPLGNVSGNDSLKKNKHKDVVYIGTNVIYAPSVEYLSTNGSAGFMLRAYKQTKIIAKSILANAIKGGIK